MECDDMGWYGMVWNSMRRYKTTKGQGMVGGWYEMVCVGMEWYGMVYDSVEWYG